MTINYPGFLPRLIQDGKTRTQPATFTITEPKRGKAYVQKIGSDVPVFWSCTLRFTRNQARSFWSWFTSPNFLDRGANSFLLDIKTEYGTVEHEVWFLPDSILPMKEDGDVITYTATIYARALVVGDADLLLRDFYALGVGDDAYRSFIDIGVNTEYA